jgi:hypothetical protein
MDDGDQNHDHHHLEDYYYDQIVRRRGISRRLNWRQRTNALSQREVATASMIHTSSTFYLSLVFLLIFLITNKSGPTSDKSGPKVVTITIFIS